MKYEKKHFCEIVKEKPSSEKIIFKIKLKGNKCAYMKVEKSNYDNNKRFIVCICAEKLLNSIKQNPVRYEHFQKLYKNSLDKYTKAEYEYALAKYGYARKAFLKGIDSPVLLAEVNYVELLDPITNIKQRKGHIGFNNGITRTLWLLNNKAAYFPVECSSKENAKSLNANFGVDNYKIFSVEELINDVKKT